MGLEARGFLLGPIIALRLGAAFVPVRKKGKLAGATVSVGYEKEYGLVNDSTCIHTHLGEIETDHRSGQFGDASGFSRARGQCNRRG